MTDIEHGAAIKVRFHGPTNYRPSRLSFTFDDRNAVDQPKKKYYVSYESVSDLANRTRIPFTAAVAETAADLFTKHLDAFVVEVTNIAMGSLNATDDIVIVSYDVLRQRNG